MRSCDKFDAATLRISINKSRISALAYEDRATAESSSACIIKREYFILTAHTQDLICVIFEMAPKKDSTHKDNPADPRPSPKPHPPTAVKPATEKTLLLIKKTEASSSKSQTSEKKGQPSIPKTQPTPPKSQPATPKAHSSPPEPRPSLQKHATTETKSKPGIKPIKITPCNICLDLDYAHIKKESATISGYAPCLQEISRSARSCTTCNIMYQAVQHCYPEVFVATSYYRVFISFFGGVENQFSNEILGLSVSPKEFPETQDDPLRKVKDGWKSRVLHIYSVPGMVLRSSDPSTSLYQLRYRKTMSMADLSARNYSLFKFDCPRRTGQIMDEEMRKRPQRLQNVDTRNSTSESRSNYARFKTRKLQSATV